jgi:protoheme IX farnesyltransferase
MLLLGCSALIAIEGLMGIIYLVSAIVLGAGFAYFCIRVAFAEGEQEEYWAKRTFAYSILYVALIFGAMSVDAVQTHHFNEYSYLMDIERDAKKMRAEQKLERVRAIHNGEAVETAR